MLGVDDNKTIKVGGRVDEMVRNLSKSKRLKNTKSEIPTYINFGAMREPIFLTPSARKTFNRLRQAFIKAPILQHFDLECYIQIKTNASGYTISEVVSQLSTNWLDLNRFKILTKSDFGQLYPVVYFFRKIIATETQYKTHNVKLLAMVEAFKT